MVVIRADLVAGTGKIVAEFVNDVLANLVLCAAGTCHEYRAGSCFRALYPLGVVVGDFRCEAGDMTGLLQSIGQPACRRYSHSRAVAVTSVRLRVTRTEPAEESGTVACVRVFSSPLLH